MACIVHMSGLMRSRAPCSISHFRCLPSLFFSAHMVKISTCGCLMALQGWNHSCYTCIPHSAPHSLQQLQSGACSPPSVQTWVSTWESHGAATQSSVSCPKVTHSAMSPQVQTSPTRTVTRDSMSATLAEAATQLSFAEFSERCISLRAPPPLALPIPTPPLDAATQTTPRIVVSQDVSTQLPLEEFSLRCDDLQNPLGPRFHFRHMTLSAPRVPDPSLRYS